MIVPDPESAATSDTTNVHDAVSEPDPIRVAERSFPSVSAPVNAPLPARFLLVRIPPALIGMAHAYPRAYPSGTPESLSCPTVTNCPRIMLGLFHSPRFIPNPIAPPPTSLPGCLFSML